MRFMDGVTVVTGGASGIGYAIGEAFGTEGSHVVLADLNSALVEEAASRLRERGCSVSTAHVDVGDAAQVHMMFQDTIDRFGTVDTLVASAGIARTTNFLDQSEEDWLDVLRINLTGVFLCGQAAARHMVKRRRGKIVNIASINGLRGVAETAAYGAAKAGVINLTRTMAVELAAHNINVNAIAPAQIDTPIYAGLSEAQREMRLTRIPLGRVGQPEEVAAATTFLASKDANFITGHVLAVDGGYLAGGSWPSRPHRASGE